MSDQPLLTADATTPVPAARWEDFVDIFTAPSRVFARREGSGFGVPMLVVTVALAVIGLATFGAMSPILDAEFARGAAAAAKKGVTAEQMEKFRSASFIFARIMMVVLPPVAIFLTGLVLWLAGKLVSARQTLSAAIMVAAYAFVPRILSALVAGVLALTTDPAALNNRYAVTASAARFLDRDTTSPILVAIAGHVDVFTIWITVLLAIGLAVTGRIPRSRAAIAAALVWVVGMVPDLWGALRQ